MTAQTPQTSRPTKSAKSELRRRLPAVAGTLIVIAVTGALVWVIRTQLGKPVQPTRLTAQTVQLVRPPPPPEEPPPPPPPPAEIEEPLEQEQAPPDEAPAEAPPALGLDQEGVAGTDGFNLLGRPGGQGLIGGTGNAVFAWYTALLKDSILDTLQEDERVRRGSYQVQVRVWLTTNGSVERIALMSTSGDRQLDAAIEAALERMNRVREAPPLEMPQPVTLRIVSRG